MVVLVTESPLPLQQVAEAVEVLEVFKPMALAV